LSRIRLTSGSLLISKLGDLKCPNKFEKKKLIKLICKIVFSHESYVQCSSSGPSFFSDDSLDEILALTARHEALMEYYFLGDFLDEKTKVCFINFFHVS